MLNLKQIEEIKGRCEKATKECLCRLPHCNKCKSDSDFISHVHTDIPNLLADREKLMAVVEAARKGHAGLKVALAHHGLGTHPDIQQLAYISKMFNQLTDSLSNLNEFDAKD